ncbi:MAG: SusC/RagA family TonB-linked outer membrane protein [Pigmentiphaga sp.]|nr:SusC/RagA family TonB-linked outer membrane protein [Pigmentiphaga sp.]
MENTKAKIKIRLCSIAAFLLYGILAFNTYGADLKHDSIRTDDKPIVQMIGEQDPVTCLQSISSVSGERLLYRPTFQMEQFLDGTLPGLFVDLTQGYPTERAGLKMRGRNLLIVVDGIPRSDANIPANQIESVSLIKDALGLVPWGMSSGDGILYIKTKRGTKSKLKIDFTTQLATAQQLYRPEFLNAYDYASMLNEALQNDGTAPLYSDEDLRLFRTGESPYTHPDIDWQDLMLRNHSPIQQYNLNMSGGSNLARYFIDINMYDQQGFLKQDKSINAYNTRENFKKYSLRSNVDVSLTANTLLQVNVFGQMFRENTPGKTMMGTIYPTLYTTPNNAYPATNPNGSFGGNPQYTNNLYAMSIASGYIMYPKTDFNYDVSLQHYFTNSLKGLYIKALYSYNSSYREALSRTKGFEIWSYNPIDGLEENDPANYRKELSASAPSSSSSYNRQYRLIYMDAALGYDLSLKEHSLNTKLSYWSNEFAIMGNTIPMFKYGFNLHSAYNFDKRYMAELSVSQMHFNYLSPSNAWGTFPALGLGWNIDKESFFNIKYIDALKLRTSFGLNGNDGTGTFFRTAQSGSMSNYYFPYIKRYSAGSGINIGKDNTSMPTIIEDPIPYDPEYEKSMRFVLAVDASLLHNSLQATVEYFNNRHFDILMTPAAKANSSLHGGATLENIGVYTQQGIETNLYYTKKFGDFHIDANLHATFMKSKLLNNGEPVYPEAYMQRVGQPYGQVFGYVAEGFFQSDEEIQEYMYPSDGSQGYTMDGYIPKPGDIRYKDLNGDYNIDDLDVQGISTTAPRIEYGVWANAGWKGIAIEMQWVGLANVQTIIRDLPFSLNSSNAYGQALKEHMDYWRTDNPQASYPRLSAQGNSYNEKTSTFWLKKVDFLRLKKIELNYTLPKAWTSNYLSHIKIFVNAYNDLTLTPLKYRDPELRLYTSGSTGIVPNFKAYNAGFNVQF